MTLLAAIFAVAVGPAAFLQPATAYDFSKLQREKLGRGVIAFRSGEREAVVTWRYRMQDPTNLAFNVYRDGQRLNAQPLSGATFYKDKTFNPSKGGLYSVRPVLGRRESTNPARGWRVPSSAPIGYIPLKVAPPPPWRNPDEPEHAPYPYRANDCSIGPIGPMTVPLVTLMATANLSWSSSGMRSEGTMRISAERHPCSTTAMTCARRNGFGV